jgi:hypothetical protein
MSIRPDFKGLISIFPDNPSGFSRAVLISRDNAAVRTRISPERPRQIRDTGPLVDRLPAESMALHRFRSRPSSDARAGQIRPGEATRPGARDPGASPWPFV